jgi:YVTN family beta-propeller protein
VGMFPTGVAITPDGAFVYVTNAENNTVSVIDTTTNTVVVTETVGPTPQFIAFATQDPVDSLIAQVTALVTGGTLTQGQANGLISKLAEARAKLDRGKSSPACNQLNAFINQVNGFVRNGSLTEAQAQRLNEAVNALKSNIGCEARRTK